MSQMPAQFSSATKNLPQPPTLPFAVPDKINETLSKIPPAQLIELIATLKNILSGPEASRAYEVFSLSPDLATCAAQMLLVMGFIDEEVISEAMNAKPIPPKPSTPSSIPQPPQFNKQQKNQRPYQKKPFPNQFGQPFNQGSQPFHNVPPNFQQQNFQNFQQPFQNFNQPSYQQNYNQPQFQQYNFNGSKWPHLPQATQAKLQAMAPDQADLIAQVLSLPADQISTLPVDQQSMVTNLRAQYL